MSQTIQMLETRIGQLDNHSRRSNLIVYGLSEEEGEDSETLEQAVNKGIIHDTLGLYQIAIERIHRLGKPAVNKIRPVIFKLLDSRNRSAILKCCSKLKNTKLSIGQDFSPKIRETREKLWDSAKANRENDEVSLGFDQLYINNRAYVWDSGINDKVPIK